MSVHVSFAKRCLGNGSQPREVPLVDKDRKFFRSYVQETCKTNRGLFRHLRLLLRFYRGFKT